MIVGDFPEQGLRVALDLLNVDEHAAQYQGHAFTEDATRAIALKILDANGELELTVAPPCPREGIAVARPLETSESMFVKQLAKQIYRQAKADVGIGFGSYPRRIQRWRGPK